MAHAWKACWVNALTGSNPVSSASLTSKNVEGPARSSRGTGPLVSVVTSVVIPPGPLRTPRTRTPDGTRSSERPSATRLSPRVADGQSTKRGQTRDAH